MGATKFSRQRESIIRNLRERCDHPTAEMIYEDVRKENPNISRGTVYRNLALLVDNGDVLKLQCGENVDRYDGCTAQHYHFVCKNCHEVTDLSMPAMDHINVLAANGFEGVITGHTAIFHGLCKKCKNRNDS